MFSQLHKKSMHLVVNLTKLAAFDSAHRRWFMDSHFLCQRRFHGHQRLFPLQSELDKITNLVIAGTSIYNAMAFEDPARVGVNYKDFVVASVEQD